ncbi:MAG: hypothetical protein V7L25_24110 [Nostoc sp.]
MAVITQIQQGGLVSKRLKKRYKTALKAFLGIPEDVKDRSHI